VAKKVKKTAEKAVVKGKGGKKTSKKTPEKRVVVKKAASKRSNSTKAQKTVAKKKTTKKKIVSGKKASPKRTLRRKVSQKRRSVLTAKELEYYRELLIEKLKELIGSVNHIESEALKTSRQDSAGDLSSMPIHMADIGSDNYEQEFALGLMDSERKIVQEIYEALKRIQNGTYGICEGTGEPIPKARLNGIPWTRYCVQFAEMVEKGLAFEPESSHEDEFEYVEDHEGADSDEDIEDEDEEEGDDDEMETYLCDHDDEDLDEEEDLL
jgi:RNA polymerase-binding transcription factor DksA